MTYKELSDEDKIMQAMQFIAVGQPIPWALEEFLREADLWEVLVPNTEEDTEDMIDE